MPQWRASRRGAPIDHLSGSVIAVTALSRDRSTMGRWQSEADESREAHSFVTKHARYPEEDMDRCAESIAALS
jgi:hypothetical protein